MEVRSYARHRPFSTIIDASTLVRVEVDDWYEVSGLFGEGVLHDLFEGAMVKIAFNVVTIQLHDVDSVHTFKDVDCPEVFVLKGLHELQLILN